MNHDILTKRIDQLTQSCQALTLKLCGFEEVLSKEAAAIARSEIKELEAITQEKVSFGEKIDEFVTDIRRHLLFLQAATDDDSHNPEGMQIEDFIIKTRLNFQKENQTDVDLSLLRLETSVQELKQARMVIFPKIEANAYMVKKLLQYHRETYAFWQAVAQESEGVYGKTGRSVSSTQKSILTVRT